MTLNKYLKSTELEVATNHICTLAKHHYKNVASLEDVAWYTKIIVKIKLSMRISTTNPRSHLFYRTNTAVLHEKERHSQSDFAYIIHPFSDFRMYWELFMMVVFLNHLVLMPMITAFYEFNLSHENLVLMAFNKLIYLETVLDICCMADVVLTFFTGYTEDVARYVILNPRFITSNYLFSIYFIIDVLSSIPTELVLVVEYNFKVLRSADPIKTMFHVNENIVGLLRYTCIFFLLMHWCGCIQYIVPCYWHGYRELPDDSWIKYRNISSTDNSSTWHIYIECVFKAAIRLFCKLKN
ncbi:i[[h]] channel isoform e [Holotrichia oblita]|uniref:I[[h]] channel isoform e n=1 Tax=Holotrichia oblita TaxID=644536 RepID=A0ACB9SKJ1_HOLOL|nr:i[[h]] channel isoform e [Holotrichia oblita]